MLEAKSCQIDLSEVKVEQIDVSEEEVNNDIIEDPVEQETTITTTNIKSPADELNFDETIPIVTDKKVMKQVDEVRNSETIESNPQNINKPRPDRSKQFLYYCVYCVDEVVVDYDQVEMVHKHWLARHSQSEKPFQFNVGPLYSCSICKKINSYRGIEGHFKRRHPEHPFVIMDPFEVKKCAICDYNGDELSKHIETQHQNLIGTNIFHPIRYSKEIVTKLRSIAVLEKLKSKTINPPYYTCGICNEKMEKQQFINHIKNHELKCLHCNSFEGKLNVLSEHNKIHNIHSMNEYLNKMKKIYYSAKIVYGNGLVLNNCNVLDPKDDGSEEFQSIFEKRIKTASCIGRSPGGINVRRASMLNRNASMSPVDDHKDNLETYKRFKDVSDYAKEEQLEWQNRYRNELTVTGLSIKCNDRKSLSDIFLKLCKHLDAPIQLDDIENIEWASEEIFVKLVDYTKKDRILNAPRLNGLKSHHFLKLQPNNSSKLIKVFPRMNKFYLRLWKNAEKHVLNDELHSFRISSQGLAIRYKPEKQEVYVKSCRELGDFVRKFTEDQRRRKYSESSPGPSTPKLMKFQ